MTSPASLAGALVLACAAVWIAGILLWRRQRPIFWFAAALTLVTVGYLVATGATEDIGRGLLPGLFDPTQRRELEAIAVRGHEKSLGLWLIGMPIGLILIYKYWKRKSCLLYTSDAADE